MKAIVSVRIICIVIISLIVSRTLALTENVGGYTYTYTIKDGVAIITTGTNTSRAISPAPQGTLVVPSSLGGCPIALGESAFYGCTGLTKVVLPDNVPDVMPESTSYIGGSSFYGCTNLREVNIPLGANDIAGVAFSGCQSLGEIDVPETVTRIGPGAFIRCYGLTNVILHAGLKKIINAAFYGCSNLKEISVPSTVTVISNDVFSKCASLEKIVLPFVGYQRGNAGTADSLFGYIFGTAEFTGGIKVKQYYSSSSYAENYIPANLKSVTITDETAIGYGAFQNCNMLTSVTLSETVNMFGDYSFEHCTGLRYIRLPSIVDDPMGYAMFRSCASLESIVVPEGILSVRGSMFKDCSKLAHVVFPKGLTTLGGQCCSGCSSLRCVSIPASITQIGEKSFYNCTAMTNVLFAGDAPSVDANGFNGVATGCRAYVRKDSTGWNVNVSGMWNGLLIDYGRYNVSFNANGGDGTMANQVIYMGEAAKLQPCTFARSDGYVFTGWATNSNGTVVYGDEASVYDLSEEFNVTVPLYAAWERRFVNVETGNGVVSVPVAWLDGTGIDMTAGYQTVAEQPAANGRPVWECYVVGTNPTNMNSRFTAAISMSNDVPYITWSPNLNTNGIERIYTVLGKTNLTDTVEWAPTNSAHRFFKVKVEMP